MECKAKLLHAEFYFSLVIGACEFKNRASFVHLCVGLKPEAAEPLAPKRAISHANSITLFIFVCSFS